MGDKPKKKRTDKSDSELTAIHLKNAAHYIDQVGNWLDKLTRAVASKKHPLTEKQKSDAAEAISVMYESWVNSLSAKTIEKPTGFKF